MVQIEVNTRRRQEFQDITAEVQRIIRENGLQDGLCYLFCPHTTAGLTLNENWDPTVRQDIGMVLDELVPQRPDFRHREGNSPAHIKTSLVGNSLTLLVEEGKLLLGTWQGVFLAEFDGPRRRRVLVKLLPG
ncbi:MAG: YjbQ family protein [Chloroflexi bacterium]|nr:MAG: YjbQ family protein [Chloroflexota bacterium]